MGQLPNDTVVMVSFRPSSNPTAPPSEAPHEVRLAPDASEHLDITHSGARELQSFSSGGNSIALTEPAQALSDNTVVDAANDLLLLKDASRAGTSSLYWALLYPRTTPEPPYSVHPPSPQAGQSYAITSNDGGRIKIVTTWPLVYAPSVGGPIPPFPG